VLIAIDSFYDGGAEMFAIRLANVLATRAKVYFFVLRPWRMKGNRQESLLDRTKVSVIELTGNRLWDFAFKLLIKLSRLPKMQRVLALANKWRLLFICKNYGIEVVNSHCWETDKAFASDKERARFRLVSSFHGHYELCGSLRSARFPKSEQLQQMDAVVYLSSSRGYAGLIGGSAGIRRKIFYDSCFDRETITRINRTKTEVSDGCSWHP
jgi:hypothetical protein